MKKVRKYIILTRKLNYYICSLSLRKCESAEVRIEDIRVHSYSSVSHHSAVCFYFLFPKENKNKRELSDPKENKNKNELSDHSRMSSMIPRK